MIRVLLVSPSRLVSSVIANVLRDVPDIKVIGSASTVEGALKRGPKCDLALVSTTLPGGGALGLTRLLSRTECGVKVLMLGLTESEEEILPFVEAGAAGYVLKEDGVEDLVAKIRAVYQGEALVSPEIAWALITRLTELVEAFDGPETIPGYTKLTPRELDVLELVAEGLSDGEIAQRLILARGTVKSHVHRILKKLKLRNRTEVMTFWSQVQDKLRENHR